jgi:hypothetical protein
MAGPHVWSELRPLLPPKESAAAICLNEHASIALADVAVGKTGIGHGSVVRV